MERPANRGKRWWLEHLLVPLALSLVAIVGAILANSIQGRHDLQKELELKTDLVARMSASATEAVFESQAVADRSVTRGAPDAAAAFQAAYDTNLRRWRVSSAEIEAALNAYFGATASTCWEDYSEVVTGYLRLNADVGQPRTTAVRALEGFFGRGHGKSRCAWASPNLPTTNWAVLRDGLDTRNATFGEIPAAKRREFLNAYAVLGDRILRIGKTLTARVVTQDAKGF